MDVFIIVQCPVSLQKLDLVEALCGMHKIIHTLDDRKLLLQTHPGDVICHGRLLASVAVEAMTIK